MFAINTELTTHFARNCARNVARHFVRKLARQRARKLVVILIVITGGWTAAYCMCHALSQTACGGRGYLRACPGLDTARRRHGTTMEALHKEVVRKSRVAPRETTMISVDATARP